ncbi:unnamed protein product [Danaus chrysippus]|uniref:(African queen) hypothetical protein n=1 Tax=Danaus chrysippus TaxID=151541 RepID=A0A8J2R448_9NEOP|nr:unnamed protein product [Danaus chrysippus]
MVSEAAPGTRQQAGTGRSSQQTKQQTPHRRREDTVTNYSHSYNVFARHPRVGSLCPNRMPEIQNTNKATLFKFHVKYPTCFKFWPRHAHLEISAGVSVSREPHNMSRRG